MSDTQNTEWVEVDGDWVNLTPGQLVEFRRVDEACRVRIVGHNSRARWANAAPGCFGASAGWSLFIEKPKVQLPTETGYYVDKDFGIWSFETNGLRRFEGKNGAEWVSPDNACTFAPFRRLRPVAEVAAEVLAEVRKSMDSRSIFFANIDALETKWATK